MSKAFTKENDDARDEDLPDEPDPLPAGQNNYITPTGLARLEAIVYPIQCFLKYLHHLLRTSQWGALRQ